MAGDTLDVTAEDVCVPGYAKKVRAVPAWLKRQAYAENGTTQYKTGDYEVDHLIPLSLEALIPFVTFGPNRQKHCPGTPYVKDALERKLHKPCTPANWISRPPNARVPVFLAFDECALLDQAAPD